jgi:hypothetical protein
MEVTQDSKDKDIIYSDFISHGVRFKPPTPPSSSFGGDSSYSDPSSPPSLITTPLLWDMDDKYGPHQYSRAINTI